MFPPLLKGYLTSGYLTKDRPTHYAIDVGWLRFMIKHPPVYAWDDGVVIASYFMSGGGNTVAILYDSGEIHWYQARYLHLYIRNVKVGDRVVAGQVIGLGGNTGLNSTGDHLHYEMLIVPFGYRTYRYADVRTFRVDPRLVTGFTDVTGEGIQKMNVNEDKLPLALPLFSNVLMRSTPAILDANKLGHIPSAGLRYHGEVVMNGFTWAILKLNDRTVYSAIADKSGKKLLDIKESVREVIVERIVQVEKPLNITLQQDGVTVTVVKEVLK
ncbi:MAG: hypothetical protein CVU96_01030 [Firmicutes bacterium HGW-Firmicutes-20]|jgi:murein DD-endopeptidase MepM/ murein hydrolase activator NlpD|nr:MAG: hypothetical protein CVU96_01030 [Firmicutes bacterium HGW-Firmicutes-20]PKM69476.1 MAG: hypothetical protein CVU94_03840 [Firmicutes bacterium HGW-Firmicutes-19]